MGFLTTNSYTAQFEFGAKKNIPEETRKCAFYTHIFHRKAPGTVMIFLT